MDDWDLFAQIRPPTPPPPRPRRTLVIKNGSAVASAAEDDNDVAVEEEKDGDYAEEVLVPVDFVCPKERAEESRQIEPKPAQEDSTSQSLELTPGPTPASSRSSAPKPSSFARSRPSTIMINGRVHCIVDDKPSTKSLEDLPPEILEQIYRRLDGESMGNLALSCKRLHEVSFNECIWTERIEREFGIKHDSYRGVSISARLFYRNVLLPYGWALGCWVRLVKDYGGLLSVVVENGIIIGKEVIPPENPNVEQNVTFKDVFCVKLDSKGRAKLLCIREQFNNDASAVRRRRRLYSNSQQSSSEDDLEAEKKLRDPAVKWDLFGNINSDGIEWEEEKKRKEEEHEAKRKEEEEKTEELKEKGVVHGVEIEYIKEAHQRGKTDKYAKIEPSLHFHIECLCPQTHKQDFEDFRQEDNTFRFLAMTKYDTIRSYGAKFTYQKYQVKPDFVFEGEQAVSSEVKGQEEAVSGASGSISATSAVSGDSNVVSGASSAFSGPSLGLAPSVCSGVDSPGFFPLKPGIFKGTFGGHGIEFVSIEKKSPYQYEAVKISGDPNVPSGKVTFCGDLRDFLFPSEEDQLSIDKLKPMEPERQQDPNVYRTLQPYRSPPDCFVRSPFPLPDQCRARFKAECQVSEWGYSAPQFIKAHLIVFTQDLLALVILDIKSVVLFHRLSASEVGLPPTPTKIFRPLPVPETAVDAAAAAEGVEAGFIEPPPKPRRAVFRWPPPKFHEALGDVDT